MGKEVRSRQTAQAKVRFPEGYSRFRIWIPSKVGQGFVMDERTKRIITKRLAGLADQLDDIERMACRDARCVEVIWQIQALQAALNRVRNLMLEEFLETCVSTAVYDHEIAERERMLKELASVYSVSKKQYC